MYYFVLTQRVATQTAENKMLPETSKIIVLNQEISDESVNSKDLAISQRTISVDVCLTMDNMLIMMTVFTTWATDTFLVVLKHYCYFLDLCRQTMQAWLNRCLTACGLNETVITFLRNNVQHNSNLLEQIKLL